MASRPPTQAPEGRRKKRSGCCLGVAVVLVVIVVALLQYGRKIAQTKLTEAVAAEVPADSWRLDVRSLDIAKALCGLPFGFDAEGQGVRPKDFPQVREVTARFRDLRLDARRKDLAGGRYEAEALIDAAALTTWAASDEGIRRVVSDLKLQVKPPDVEVQGVVRIGDLAPDWASLGTLQVTARGKPAIVENGTMVGIELAEVQLGLPGALDALGLPRLIPVPPEFRSALPSLLRLDLRRALPGLQLQSVAAEAGGLRLRGQGTLPPPRA